MKPNERAKVFNRIADAYAEGRAPYLYDERGSLAVRLWCLAEREDSEKAADECVIALLLGLPSRSR